MREPAHRGSERSVTPNGRVAAAPTHAVLALQRSVGNRAVGRILARTITIQHIEYSSAAEVKQLLANKREKAHEPSWLKYAQGDRPEEVIDEALQAYDKANEMFSSLWELVERLQEYKSEGSSGQSSSPAAQNPLAAAGMDWVFVHYLFSGAHHEEGPVRTAAVSALNKIQTEFRFSGDKMLELYGKVLGHLVEQGIGEEASRRLLQEVRNYPRDTAPGLMPFEYGGHHAYVRIGRVQETSRYRLEYFDRQRQSLRLDDRDVPGYDAEAGGRPLWFEFTVGSLDAMMAIYTEAGEIAHRDTSSRDTDGPRQAVLEHLAGKAAAFGLLGDVNEPAQHARSAHCQWASLESVIRTQAGAEALEAQLAELRKWVRAYVESQGSETDKQALGI
jgi:hypothetical protein